MSDKFKFKIGSIYMIKFKGERSVDVLRELNLCQILLLNVGHYIKQLLKLFVILTSMLVPPLLLVTIPLLRVRRNNDVR